MLWVWLTLSHAAVFGLGLLIATIRAAQIWDREITKFPKPRMRFRYLHKDGVTVRVYEQDPESYDDLKF